MRPKSREETPKEGIGGKRLAAPQQYARAVHKKQGVCPIFLENWMRVQFLVFI
jgi:hypothetical protein